MRQTFYGNAAAKQMLHHMLNGNLHHAYLIYGADGLGKKTFAKYLAQSIFCKGKAKPCFVCESCYKIQKNIHPDMILIDEGSTHHSIKIETIRNLCLDCVIKPNEGLFKIYIITDVQNMTTGALNAFLKTLEEPPANVIFLLLAPNRMLLADTMVSRLVPIELFTLNQQEWNQALTDYDVHLSQEKKDVLWASTQGNLGQAQIQLQQQTNEDQALKQLYGCLLQRQEYQMLKLFYQYEKNKMALLELFNQLLVLFRECLIVQLKSRESQLFKEEIRQLKDTFTKKQIIQLIELIENLKIKISSNANMNLLIADICVELKEIIT